MVVNVTEVEVKEVVNSVVGAGVSVSVARRRNVVSGKENEMFFLR